MDTKLTKVTDTKGSSEWIGDHKGWKFSRLTEEYSQPGILSKRMKEGVFERLDYKGNPYETVLSRKTESFNDKGQLETLIENGHGKLIEYTYKDEQLNNKDQSTPAVTGYLDSYLTMTGWFENGQLHKVGAPSYIDNSTSGYSYYSKFPEMDQYLPNNPQQKTNPETAVKEYWSINGKAHREDGPALTRKNGTQEWYQNGLHHREDGPAIVEKHREIWYKNGEIHRDDGPAIVLDNGTEVWYQHGKIHREGGPAVTENGTQKWYQHGKLHREDGPAIIEPDGKEKYYKNGLPDFKKMFSDTVSNLREVFSDHSSSDNKPKK
jgi:hypothetical protein